MIGSLFRTASMGIKTVGTHMGGHALLAGLTVMSVGSDMKKARQEGRSPLSAGIHSAAGQILPLLMTMHIKSISRQVLGFSLISNPAMLTNAVKGVAMGGHHRYMANLEAALPFSHTYAPTQQAYVHMQQGLQSMGNTGWAGSEAAVFSARYMNNRY